MIHVITCNPLVGKSIKDYLDNFIVCHVSHKILIPMVTPTTIFDVYHQDGMELSDYDEYTNEPGFQYNFIPCEGITTALDTIAESVMNDEVDEELKSDDTGDAPDEVTLAIATQSIAFNRQFTKYLNTILRDGESEVKALDMFQYMKITKMSQLENMVKAQLQTEYVYPEDPIAFGYCLDKLLNGVIM